MKLSQAMAALRERIRQRVEGEIDELPDFRPPSFNELEKRRQQASNWAAVVGAVNPRPGRLRDAPAQALKRMIARLLRWHVFPQRQFNQAQLDTIAEIQQLLADHNRNLAVLAQAIVQAQQTAFEALEQTQTLGAAIPAGMEEKLQAAEAKIETARQSLEGEIQEQRRTLDGRMTANLAEVRAKVDSLEYHLIENVKALNASLNEMQKKFWDDMNRWQGEHQNRHLEQSATLDQELRLVRQRLRAEAVQAAFATAPPGAAASPAEAHGAPGGRPEAGAPYAVPRFDYSRFQERFRGLEPEIRERQTIYWPLFRDRAPVLDVACGRGEFLAFLGEKGVEARGVDIDPDMVARCREQGLSVECADAFAFLEQLPDDSLGAIFSAQFIEHLPPGGYVRLIQLAFRKLKKRGLLLLETQNPQCLATLSQNFYMDPTHVNPIPAGQLQFWMEEGGFCDLATYYVSPVEPALPVLPLFKEAAGNLALERWNSEAERFNRTYFGCQDYAVAGLKP